MSHPSEHLVCAACGGSRIDRIERGIDNWPVGVCRSCYPNPRKFYPRVPLIEASKWKPPAVPEEAPSIGAFD